MKKIGGVNWKNENRRGVSVTYFKYGGVNVIIPICFMIKFQKIAAPF